MCWFANVPKDRILKLEYYVIFIMNLLCLLFTEKKDFLLVKQEKTFSVETGFEELKKEANKYYVIFEIQSPILTL